MEQKQEKPTNIFIGVDGGGTKTLFIAVDQNKHVIGRVTKGSTNPNNIGKELSQQTICQGIDEIIAEATKFLSQQDSASANHTVHVKTIVLGMAGVDRPDDVVMMKSWVQKVLPHAEVLVHNDAVTALASGTEGKLLGIG